MPTSAAMVITIGNDVTGVCIADNWLVAPIGEAFRKGVIMIFGG